MAMLMKMWDPEVIGEMEILYLRDGLSVKAVSDTMDIGVGTVTKLFRRYGIKRRSHKEAGKIAGLAISKKMKGRCVPHRPKGVCPDGLRRAAIARSASCSGKRIGTNGYVTFINGDKKGLSLHRVAMEEFIGRKLLHKEVVHHIDGNRLNNALSNLMLMSSSEHARLHRLQESEKRKGSKNVTVG